eukprot:767888-Hanusia_phi.AAC.3
MRDRSLEVGDEEHAFEPPRNATSTTNKPLLLQKIDQELRRTCTHLSTELPRCLMCAAIARRGVEEKGEEVAPSERVGKKGLEELQARRNQQSECLILLAISSIVEQINQGPSKRDKAVLARKEEDRKNPDVRHVHRRAYQIAEKAHKVVEAMMLRG